MNNAFRGGEVADSRTTAGDRVISKSCPEDSEFASKRMANGGRHLEIENFVHTSAFSMQK